MSIATLVPTLVYFDWETYSQCDLKLCGGFAYAAHPSTRPLCAYIEVGDERVFWTPEYYPGWSPPEGVRYAWGLPWMIALFSNPNFVFIGHNADFDQAIAEITLGLPRRTWIDTMALADTMGYPGGLDGIGQLLYGQGKDKKGYRLMMSLCKPNRKGMAPHLRHQDLSALCIYNIRDIAITRRFWTDYGPKLPQVEMPVYFAHHAVNWRGVPLDLEFIRGLRDLNLEITGNAGRLAEQWTANVLGSDGKGASLSGDDLTRVEYLQDWFNDQGKLYGGWSIDSCDEDTLETMLAQPDAVMPPHIKAVIQARLSVAGAAVAKLRSMLNRVSPDGRLRGEYRYHGTLTGRWKSLGVQIHNLARPHPMFMSDANPPTFSDGTPNKWHSEAIIDAIRAAAVKGSLGDFLQVAQTVEDWRREHINQLGIKLAVSVPHCFKSVVRSMFIPSPGKVFVGADYSSIEGRGAAWLAHDEPILEAYRAYDAKQGPDLYCVMATTIFGRQITKKDKIERQVGKVAELGCLAPDTLVLTKFGPKRLADICAGDMVWDGADWVTTGGVVPRGVKETIAWHGIRLTADHLVLVDGGWRQAGSLSGSESMRALAQATAMAPGQWSDWNAVFAGAYRMCGPDATAAPSRGALQEISYMGSPQAVLGVTPKNCRAFDGGISVSLMRCQKKTTEAASSIGSTLPFTDVTTRQLLSIVIMAVAASMCVIYGSATTRNSYGMSVLCAAGIILISSLTGSTMTAGTSRVISVSPRKADRCVILASIAASVIWGKICRSLSSGSDMLRVMLARALLAVSELAAGPQPGSSLINRHAAAPSEKYATEERVIASRASVERSASTFLNQPLSLATSEDGVSERSSIPPCAEPVFDLLNCGPHNRFSIMTDAGLALVHNCTYQMGAEKLQNTDNNAAELAAAGVSATDVVQAWRTKHRITARYWKDLDKALKFAITDTRGRSHWANEIEFTYNYGLLEIRLPVGRSIWYHNPLLRPSARFEGATEVVYENYRKGQGEYATMTLHGGKVLENINQGICRDLLANKLVECENAGVETVMHTHDEINAECDRADAPDVARWLEERMGEAPAWAAGFPMKGEPGIMERYGK